MFFKVDAPREGRAPRLRMSRTPPQAVASPQDEISLRNNLEDAEVAVKTPRLRVRQGKPGCNGRDEMRFHCVIISLEGVAARGALVGVRRKW